MLNVFQSFCEKRYTIQIENTQTYIYAVLYRIVKWLTQDLIKVPEQNVKQNSRFLK